MTQETIQIHDQVYTLYTHYQHQEKLRLEFNRMTQEFWAFDFENYYQSGFWDDDTCILYSLFVGNSIASHTTVSLFEYEGKTLIQLGTVMTGLPYRNKGLSRFLMERILRDFEGKHAGIFLFANETVLDFYPKFGLLPVPESEHFFNVETTDSVPKLTRRQLNLDHPDDLKLFENRVENAVSNSRFTPRNKGLTFFYCYAYPEMGFKNSVYFVEAFNSVVIAQIEEDVLYITAIFAPEEMNVKQLTGAFTDFSFKEVVLGFTPKETAKAHARGYKEDDLQLFVSPELHALFANNPLRVPLLSHT